MTLLEISSLTLDLANGKRLLDRVSMTIEAGETVGLVGGSGSGKSLTARAVLGLLPMGAHTAGSVHVGGVEVLGAPEANLLRVRRGIAAMIFQDPRASINPMRTLGDHMTESLRLCAGASASEARATAIELLSAVRLPRPEEHLSQYPHEFSGGMLQRVMIAGALTSSPQLLVCDEPTTALDVTTQAEIVRVLAEQRELRGMGMLFITHDLNLAASICDRVYVMSDGRVDEHGVTRQIFLHPTAVATKRLIDAAPSVQVRDSGRQSAVDVDADATRAEPMLWTQELAKSYTVKRRAVVRAVAGATISIPRGGSLGIVGESGSGKSTLARMIVGLESPDSGELRIGGTTWNAVPRDRAERLQRARSVQMVFQDPYLSLDPRIPVGRAIEDSLTLHTRLSPQDRRARVLELLGSVGLVADHAQSRPRTLSGGQRQRVAIARALAVDPDLLVMDEATSALDVSVQAQVLDLLAHIQKERGVTLLFISHDLGVVRRVCDRAVVMRHGEIVESGPTELLLGHPQHEYTRLLIDSVPRPAWDSSTQYGSR
ncbi:ABC transporter ATP-binding protein [soil metagenome]